MAELSEEERQRRNATARAAHAANREQRNARRRELDAANPNRNNPKRQEQKRQAGAKWRAANPENIRGRNQTRYALKLPGDILLRKQWRLNNREQRNKSNRASAARNAAKIKQKNDRLRHAHPERYRAYNKIQRARRAGSAVNDFTAAQWEEMKAASGYRCAYCDRVMQRLTQDHIVPLSKGGAHTASNIVPACKSCNSRKYTGPPLKPVQPVLLTIAAPRKKTKRR